MTPRHLFTTLLVLFAAITATAQNFANQLIVPDVTTPPSSEFQLPVQLDNADQIVAAQFKLKMPQGTTLNASSIFSTQRLTDHQVVIRLMEANTYLIMLYSPSNAPILGRTGSLFTIGANVGALQEGSEHPISLTDVVLSDAQGNDLTGNSVAGKLIIAVKPDLTVTDVTSSTNSIVPGTEVGISWTVKNIGGLATSGGWTERISLVTTSGTSKHLITLAYNDILAANGQVTREANVLIPDVLGLNGEAVLQVQIVPNADCNEGIEKQGNNTATSATVNVSKKLTLKLSPIVVAEANGNTVKGMVTRSGDWSQEQIFTLSCTSDTRITMPSQVAIPAGKSSEYFYLTITADGIFNDKNTVKVSVYGNDYAKTTATLGIEDDTFPPLHVTLSEQNIDEGQSFVLNVKIDKAASQDVLLNVNCDKAVLFQFPSQVTLPAGQKSIDINVVAIDDEVPYLSQAATFIVSATGYESDEDFITVTDNDIPEIELTLTPTTVSEGAGVMAINAQLRRVSDANSKITIKLSDDSEGDIYYPLTTITLEKGVTSADFTLGVVDNALADGDRTVNIKAAVYIASCSCQATGDNGGAVTVPVTIIDNDGPSLSIKSSLSTVLEGGSTVVTVTRNNSPNSALTVQLTSNAEDALNYTHTVTIPAGQTSAETTISIKNNSVEGDSRVIELRATAQGYAVGTTWFLVSDQTLPDAVVRSIAISESEVYVGDEVILNITFANEGASPLPSQTLLAVYVDNATSSTCDIRLADALVMGSEQTITRTITMPTVPGNHTIKVVANGSHSFSELSYTNNEAIANVEVLPQFSATVTADKQAYTPGETVTLTGTVTGRLIGGQTVELYIINNGLRQTIEAVTDASGNFSATWTPAPAQMGHFVAGACYPGENLKTAQTEFDVYGIEVANRYQTAQMTVGEEFSGSIAVSNKGNLSQSGIKVNVVQGADNIETQFSTISSIPGGNSSNIAFKLNATAPTNSSDPNLYNGWQHIKLQITDDQGAATDYSLYCYAALPTAKLEPSLAKISTTVPKDGTHDIEFTIHNVGRGATGAILLSLPPYITSLTPTTLPSLNFDETATIALRFGVPNGMQLSQIMKGNIAFNCTNGTGLALPFEFELVSDAVGTITIDVTDEYTYYTEEAPHVAGATVTFQHPVTKAIIAQGVTDENGLYTIQLNEGYYNVTVTEDSHTSATKTVLVDPGREKRETIVLSVNGVEITYEIVETEVEDVYEIITHYNFETNVPVPVVTLDFPSHINGDDMAVGESILVDAVFTNHGLITAEDVELILPEHAMFNFMALEWGTFSLAPNQTKIIKVIVTKTALEPQDDNQKFNIELYDCHTAVHYKYRWKCDNSTHKLVVVKVPFRVRECKVKPTGDDLPDWKPREGGGSPNYPPIIIPNWLQWLSDLLMGDNDSKLDLNCKPCMLAVAKTVGTCLIDAGLSMLGVEELKWLNALISGIKCLSNFYDYATLVDGMSGWDTSKAIIGCANTIANIPFAECVLGVPDVFYHCIYGLISDWLPDKWNERINKFFGGPDIILGKSHQKAEVVDVDYPSYVHECFDNIGLFYRAIYITGELRAKMFSNDSWIDSNPTQLNSFLNLVTTLSGDEIIEGDLAASIIAARPDNISTEVAQTFINRWNNTLMYYKGQFDNVTETFALTNYSEEMEEIHAIKESVEQLGYADFEELLRGEVHKFKEAYASSSNNVCSTISLEFKQTLTLTRQGFLGTLTVKNNHETNPIEDFQLHLEVRDPDGNLAGSDKMEIHTETLNGFIGDLQLGSNWNLANGATGIATVKYIPTDKAAPEHDLDYTFGGTVTFVDPYSGLTVSRELTPKTLTVRPSPQLYLDYFMQRDVLGDDPLTPNVVEPSLPAEFALLINNRGAGDANNVKITTAQPQITENDKGLLIEMALYNGQEAGLVLSDQYVNDFGTIASGDHALAQWYLRSSLLGHFTSYSVEVNHVTGFDNPDLSLVKDAQIHEMIHECVDQSQQVAFLVNDDVDANDTPDHIFFLNGEAATVSSSATMTASQTRETQLTLNMSNAAEGWNYANAIDPTLGMVEIVKVVRQSDGTEIPVANVWLTDRTLRDGRDPLYENRIHIADYLTAAGNEVYVITVTPIVQPMLEVEAIEGVETTALNTQAVTTATVRFNKAIKASSFTTADVTLMHEGVKLDATKIIITKVNNREFSLNLSALTAYDGYYTLTVATSAITDADGYNGRNGKMVGWTQLINGKVAYKVIVNPTEGGEVSSTEGQVPVGGEVTLTATPADGYQFAGWYIANEKVSDQSECTFTLDATITTIEARFSQIIYDVTVSVETSGAGTIEGNGNGKYTWGDVLHLTAVPAKYFEFTGWTVNGKKVSTDPTLELTVTEPVTIVANFDAIVRVTIDYALKTGWNWISFGVEDESMEDLNDALGSLYSARTLLSNAAQATHSGLWNGSIDQLSPIQSYKIQMISDGEFAITGEPVVDATVTLTPGWNWLGYLPTEELSVAEALTFVPAEAGDVLKGQNSFVLFDGEQWLGNLTTMKPGLGYMYFSKSTKSFGFPEQHMASHSHIKAYSEKENTDAPWNYDPYKYANNMAINAVVSDIALSDGAWIGAFVGEECRGAATLTNGIFYLTVHGDIDGEELKFKLFDTEMGTKGLIADNAVNFVDTHTPVATEPLQLKLDDSGINSLQYAGSLKIYPVPVTDRLHIKGMDDVDCLIIHAISGRQMIKISNTSVINGIDVSQLTDGMYVISIQSGNRRWSSIFIKK